MTSNPNNNRFALLFAIRRRPQPAATPKQLNFCFASYKQVYCLFCSTYQYKHTPPHTHTQRYIETHTLFCMIMCGNSLTLALASPSPLTFGHAIKVIRITIRTIDTQTDRASRFKAFSHSTSLIYTHKKKIKEKQKPKQKQRQREREAKITTENCSQHGNMSHPLRGHSSCFFSASLPLLLSPLKHMANLCDFGRNANRTKNFGKLASRVRS